MPRIPHGAEITTETLQDAFESMSARSAEVPLAFAAMATVDLQDFDFLFSKLQSDPANLLPVSPKTREHLVELGRVMRDESRDKDGSGDSNIPAGYTYFGQFVDHDITLEEVSSPLPKLLDPNLAPLSLETIRNTLQNRRNATLDLDSVYGLPAPRDPANKAKLKIGTVTPLKGTEKPNLRPKGKGDKNDLPREARSDDPTIDRAAQIGDPRNDENTVISQLHLAFLRAHNALVDQGKTFRQAQRLLRQHYQHIVIHDFLKRIVDPKIVEDILKNGNRFYDGMAEPFFLPLEFVAAAYRFGHSMIRADYDFNLNFNTSGEPGTFPASLGLLFTFTALSGELGSFDTLPDNWIIEWQHFVDTGVPFNKARRFDTKLVEPLFELPDIQGVPEKGDGARLAVRNLLRGYLLRMPTGQAVARAIGQTPLTRAEIEAAAASAQQSKILRESGFIERTPLWYYVLVEAAARAKGQHLGPVGSTIVAEVLIGLARRSKDSILRQKNWQPSLPSAKPGTFTLTDLLKLAKVL
ncbi:peroxidase [Phormidium tenue FACHB-886]|nr:peroxidase [Phormidium tenue FACHB-886]